MNSNRGFADVNGTRLYFETLGSGEPLVLIHGNALDTRMWDDQFEAFAETYQVIRYDMRGFGKSALPTEENYSEAADLKALLQYLELTHAHILGLSLGGAIAIDFALAYPKEIKTLIAVDSGLRGYEWKKGFGEYYAEVLSKGEASGIEAARQHWMSAELFSPAMEHPNVAEHLRKISLDYSGWHWINNQDNILLLDPLPIQQLHNIHVPTLIIVGERDLPDFHAVADILQKGISNASKVVMPGVGHMSSIEAPEDFNEIVLSFLADK